MTSKMTREEREAHDRANNELGQRFVRALAAEKALSDRRLDPSALRVLGALLYFMNSKTQRAWPSYKLISEVTGLADNTIESAIRQLRATGYVFSERRAPIYGGRALAHYGLFAVDPGQIDAIITAAVLEVRERRERGPAPEYPKKRVVRTDLTTSGTGESEPVLTTPKTGESDPDYPFSPTSDYPFSPRQEPIREEPIKNSEVKREKGARARPYNSDIDFDQTEWTEIAIGTGLNETAISRTYEKFAAYVQSDGTLRVDWSAYWRGWCLREVEYLSRERSKSPGAFSAQTARDAWKQAARERGQ